MFTFSACPLEESPFSSGLAQLLSLYALQPFPLVAAPRGLGDSSWLQLPGSLSSWSHRPSPAPGSPARLPGWAPVGLALTTSNLCPPVCLPHLILRDSELATMLRFHGSLHPLTVTFTLSCSL